jgi:nanoRNase/pAp phosphatase (c-di-AMP/oligoRNAs hydrolase)
MFVGDPDAMASAMALKKILVRKVESVGLAMVNEVTRPDNLAMIKYLKIPVKKLTPLLAAQYDKFALVDSQPHHNPEFLNYEFTIVIDHHPISEKNPVKAEFVELQPEYGANSTILTEFLYNLKLKPGRLLSTALLYGIKTDTHSFENNFHDADMRAFRYLSKFAHHNILRKIVRSEYKLEWLKYFSQALKKVRVIGDGLTVFMGEVDSTDILVILADFFMKIHDISWDIIIGIYENKLVAIFRGDGIKHHMGKLAQRLFADVGSAGGHKAMARAEVDLKNIDEHPQQFMWSKLEGSNIVKKLKRKNYDQDNNNNSED